ncbi:hypothetical protein GLOIN_2v1849173 [Rhizophagus irregularis DAOM 181602=DAOM 197198]|nr:hypothetical protein GLOIN_2v1849173 [Rhizophagus irregularis DAOM 181602=DAOM 197198]
MEDSTTQQVYTRVFNNRTRTFQSDGPLIQDGKPNALIYDREARIPGTVIFARGRKITSEAIQPYKDKVRRIHTDGFILEEQPDSPALFTCSENADTTLKTFKFETAGYCHVKNANKVIWT